MSQNWTLKAVRSLDEGDPLTGLGKLFVPLRKEPAAPPIPEGIYTKPDGKLATNFALPSVPRRGPAPIVKRMRTPVDAPRAELAKDLREPAAVQQRPLAVGDYIRLTDFWTADHNSKFYPNRVLKVTKVLGGAIFVPGCGKAGFSAIASEGGTWIRFDGLRLGDKLLNPDRPGSAPVEVVSMSPQAGTFRITDYDYDFHLRSLHAIWEFA